MSTSRPPRPASRRLRIEPLEDRRLLAVFTVTNLDDSGAGSLRQAILDANAAPGADEIEFDAAAVGRISLVGELAITDSLTINGPGPSLLTIDANEQSRVFNIDDGNDLWHVEVTIDGVTVTGGLTTDEGGGIRDHENLTVINSTLSGNTADSRGGGIYAFGDVSVTNSTISDNTAGGAGGGIHIRGDLTLNNSEISGNESDDAGGGVFVRGDATVTNSTISGNISSSQYGSFQSLAVSRW